MIRTVNDIIVAVITTEVACFTTTTRATAQLTIKFTTTTNRVARAMDKREMVMINDIASIGLTGVIRFDKAGTIIQRIVMYMSVRGACHLHRVVATMLKCVVRDFGIVHRRLAACTLIKDDCTGPASLTIEIVADDLDVGIMPTIPDVYEVARVLIRNREGIIIVRPSKTAIEKAGVAARKPKYRNVEIDLLEAATGRIAEDVTIRRYANCIIHPEQLTGQNMQIASSKSSSDRCARVAVSTRVSAIGCWILRIHEGRWWWLPRRRWRYGTREPPSVGWC